MKDPIVTSVAPHDCHAANYNSVKAKSIPAPTKPPPCLKHSFPAKYNDDLIVRHTESVDALIRVRLLRNDDGDVDDSFYIGDVGEIIRQQNQFKRLLPRVEPFYAVKCNPDPVILTAMVRLGTGFDCASRAEMDAVLKLGVDPSRIIYANPCKQASHIRFASQAGVRMMTFDNEDELYKIKKHHSNPQVVLRVLTDDSRSICKFGVKFGAHQEKTKRLLSLAKEIGINVIGVSFHVGSGCFDANSYYDAISLARSVFDEAATLGFNLTLLDIGGGFPGADWTQGSSGISFPEIGNVVRPALDEFFPEGCGYKIIAEPGRFYVSSAFTLAVNVHSRRVVGSDIQDQSMDQKVVDIDDQLMEEKDVSRISFMYYINEGLYSSFNCIYFDHAIVTPQVLYKTNTKQYFYQQPQSFVTAELGSNYPCSIWGPTCDSMDVITKNGKLPELDVGDWLYFDNMGAYTVAASSPFNGFKRCQVIWTNTEAHNFAV